MLLPEPLLIYCMLVALASLNALHAVSVSIDLCMLVAHTSMKLLSAIPLEPRLKSNCCLPEPE